MTLASFEIFTFLSDFSSTLLDTYSEISDWLMTEYDIPLFNAPVTVFEILFGAGVTVILGYMLTKWILDIVL